jgi:DDE family transposase
MPTDADDSLLPFSLPSIGKKKVTAAFDAGQISSDGGVLLLAGADKRLGLIDTLAALIPDHRESGPYHPHHVGHPARPHLRDCLRLPGC